MCSVARCRAEIAAVEAQIRAGHPDLQGLCLALADWSAELRLLQASGGLAPGAPQSAHVRAGGGTWQYWPTQVLAQLGSLNQTDQEHQHHGSDCRSDQAPDQSTCTEAKSTKDPTSYESANDAEDQISNQSVAAAFHQQSGKPAGHQADDEKPQKMHILFLRVRAAR